MLHLVKNYCKSVSNDGVLESIVNFTLRYALGLFSALYVQNVNDPSPSK